MIWANAYGAFAGLLMNEDHLSQQKERSWNLIFPDLDVQIRDFPDLEIEI